jgi:hypothetical protein
MILQTAQARTDEPDRKTNEGCMSCSHSELEVKWREICERINVDADLDEHGQ